jgi:hypothetical protein
MSAAQNPRVVTGLVAGGMMVWYAKEFQNVASGYVGIAIAVVGAGLLVRELTYNNKRRRIK